MKRLSRTIAIATLALAPLVAVTTPAEASPGYRNCTQLTRDFSHGVARSKAAARYQVRQGNSLPAYGKRAKRVYWVSRSDLDRDKDGTACER